jgi:hypothetical protein
MHNPKTQLASSEAMGLYLSNLELEVSASREDGQGDPENLFWVGQIIKF